MQFHILTIFPDILDSYTSKGMLRIAQEKNIIKIKTHDLRDFSDNKQRNVDDKPYGGGPGQVLMVEPVVKAIKQIKKRKLKNGIKRKVILLSAKGKRWNQQLAKKYSKLDEVTFVCPRYEGHDERIKKFVDEEVSIGDFVLTGGELGAAVIIDSVSRLLPGVLGKKESLTEESHSTPGYLEYPQYTRPEVFEIRGSRIADRKATKKTTKFRVPKVLLSGHHKKIKEWREKHEKQQ
ncbi:tRNA (guanosine(37)-N1)-methyltransferase TrmD [Candidatus Falkowbacteria bacterium]|jgi:tRNA (guanine37-N1)-methyltransferase|nr:tRNA (guanosine(37)-N1)-methyltransferase TrmD [Candidatus Falkowbacteria bacterium]MBT7007112.1 tRNA (guanosine(37)-N1)-methyltransferase TrmD [Candidatus Falkowbacteria bacterium]